MSREKQIDYETLVKAMREYPFLFPQFCTKDTITCKISLWNEIADIIEDLAGYRKQSEVIKEIIDIIGKRKEINQYHLQGNHTDLFQGVYCGRDEAYRDIIEIIEHKYGAKMKGGAE